MFRDAGTVLGEHLGAMHHKCAKTRQKWKTHVCLGRIAMGMIIDATVQFYCRVDPTLWKVGNVSREGARLKIP